VKCALAATMEPKMNISHKLRSCVWLAYPLGQGKLSSSPWARVFLDTFVIGSVSLPTAN